MTTTISIPYTIDAAQLTLTNTGKVIGIPNGAVLAELESRDPVAFAAIMEFKSLATASGIVTVSAV